MLQCYNVTMLQCYNVTMLQCYNVTMLQCYNNVTKLHIVYYNVTILKYYNVTSCHPGCSAVLRTYIHGLNYLHHLSAYKLQNIKMCFLTTDINFPGYEKARNIYSATSVNFTLFLWYLKGRFLAFQAEVA